MIPLFSDNVIRLPIPQKCNKSSQQNRLIFFFRFVPFLFHFEVTKHTWKDTAIEKRCVNHKKQQVRIRRSKNQSGIRENSIRLHFKSLSSFFSFPKRENSIKNAVLKSLLKRSKRVNTKTHLNVIQILVCFLLCLKK